ncbi:MAG: 4-hydroxy-3-methylbut-2-enyl diphosphate reductase [Crocinitomicaceae bacterium]|nr:4-hydroxy-3-methylbut-2-enyl diphosphate reductase [Crocinitomicaceae bacterium]
MKQFDIPTIYRSPIISKVKAARKDKDPRKKDFTPSVLDFGPVQFYIARHFGFCYGVENAIEISYRAIAENEGKNIYLLSQMIHNPDVNEQLISNGIQFLQDTYGKQLIPFEHLKSEDVVIIPAFGTTIEIMARLAEIGVDVQKYDTTCPFVEKVWNRSEKLGKEAHSIIIHGKHQHEETRATFSHSAQNAPAVVVKDMEEAKVLASFILEDKTQAEFEEIFAGKFSQGFNIYRDLDRVGVVNQTTMLASETQAIADYFRTVMVKKFGEAKIKDHFADTRDTLCYATNDNQNATYGLMEVDADLAIVVGGYNSSNTTHLVELLEQKYPTYFIKNVSEIQNKYLIQHYDIHENKLKETLNFIPEHQPLKIILTSGASCPDALVDEVLQQILTYFPDAKSLESVLESIELAD